MERRRVGEVQLRGGEEVRRRYVLWSLWERMQMRIGECKRLGGEKR